MAIKSMNIKSFNTKEEFINASSDYMIDVVNECIKLGQTPTVLLSGGGTPGPIYEKFNGVYTGKTEVAIGLIDERFVPTIDDKSNEKMIRSKLTSPSFNISGLVKHSDDYAKNISVLNEVHSHLIKEIHLSVLGMGEDGHFASIFPNDPLSERACCEDRPYLNTTAPSEPKQRITCSLKTILSSDNIILFITGKKKLNILKDFSLNLPIHSLLTKRDDILIYYTD